MSYIFLVAPLAIFALFLSFYSATTGVIYSLPWIPQLGINLSFTHNKLSLFTGLLIAATGVAITFYATQYMKTEKNQYRFWTFFLTFMLSMLGLVMSENLITLFLFWEATSICSFFLIGHYFEDPEARRSAFNSLVITGGGGVFLLVGFIALASIGGSYEISSLIENKAAILESPHIGVAFFFIMIGVMTKSAQFPFHFWLPMAMTGPAPVSAFLHSATMVKAGVFLLARFFPLFSELNFWEPVLTTIGLATFVWGGFVAIRYFDIKKILANTTISALGCLVALLGMAKSFPKGLEAFLLFFIAHAFYKASLFMCAGIIEKKFGIKDIRQIQMSFKEDPLLALSLIISAFSMMGLPPTIGFIAKETFLEFASANSFYLIFLILGGLFNFIAAGKLIYHLFLSSKSHSEVKYSSTILLSLFPFILSLLTIYFSFSADVFLNNFVSAFVFELSGIESPINISLWHGPTLALFLSFLMILIGTLILIWMRFRTSGLEDKTLSSLSPTEIYKNGLNFFLKKASSLNVFYQSGLLRYYFITIFFAASIFIFMGILYFSPQITFTNSPIQFTDVCLGLLIIFSTTSTLVTESKIWAVTQIGIVGTCLILFFIFYGAPDLALTQLLVEIFTLTIFVFALHKLPRLRFYSSKKSRRRDLFISGFFGLLMGYLTYFSFGKHLDKSAATFYAENAFTEAFGKNIVNVILVDFRAFDTLGEISVILMAAIGVYILMRKRGAS